LTATARKTHPGKFSPTLHKTGQYCKKIKGKLHNFGSGKKKPFNATLTGENSGIGTWHLRSAAEQLGILVNKFSN